MNNINLKLFNNTYYFSNQYLLPIKTMLNSSQQPQQNLTFQPESNNYFLFNFNERNFRQKSQLYPELNPQLYHQFWNTSQQILLETAPQLNKVIKALVIGYPGSGKTFFVNNMCGTEFESGVSMKRMTTKIELGCCRYVQNGKFKIWDTPALTRQDIKKTNRKLIRQILQTNTFDVILVIVPFDSRFEDVTLTNLQQIQEMIKKQLKKCCQIVFMVSNLDEVSHKVKDSFINSFSHSIEQLKITNKVILFSNINSNFKNLAKQLYNSSSNHPSQESPQLQLQLTQMSQISYKIEIHEEEQQKNNHPKINIWYQWQQFKKQLIKYCNLENALTVASVLIGLIQLLALHCPKNKKEVY